MDGTMWVTVSWFRPLFRRSRQFDLEIGARAQTLNEQFQVISVVFVVH
jgi:uncharacterized Rmd1/YagE family protein